MVSVGHVSEEHVYLEMMLYQVCWQMFLDVKQAHDLLCACRSPSTPSTQAPLPAQLKLRREQRPLGHPPLGAPQEAPRPRRMTLAKTRRAMRV